MRKPETKRANKTAASSSVLPRMRRSAPMRRSVLRTTPPIIHAAASIQSSRSAGTKEKQRSESESYEEWEE